MRFISLFIAIALSVMFTSACASSEPAPAGEAAEISVPSPAAVDVVAAAPQPEVEEEPEYELIQFYDLNLYIPGTMEADKLIGSVTSLYVNIDGSHDSWLEIDPQRLDSEDNRATPTPLDDSGAPVITIDTVAEGIIPNEDITFTELGNGSISIGGMPASYIELELCGESWYGGDIWKMWVVRVVYGDFRYDFMYASKMEQYETYLPVVDKMIASAGFDSGEGQTSTVTFADITFSHPARSVNVSISDDAFNIGLVDGRMNGVAFRADVTYDQFYTDGFLEHDIMLSNHLQTSAKKRGLLEPREISREETEINGKRAVRAVYHDDFRQYNNYLEMIVFIHNYDLYTLFGRCNLGAEDQLQDFMQPIIDSIVFNESAVEHPRVKRDSDTVRWINYTYAIITLSNNGDIELYGGHKPSILNKARALNGLIQSWGITDKESSNEVLNRLYESGHRARFFEFVEEHPMYKLEPEEFEAALKELEDGNERYILENTYYVYRQFGDKTLLAWDYCRMLNILSQGYFVGYYSYEEALDLSLPIALELQEAYSSWDDLYRDYLAGFNFWSPGDVSNMETENFRRLMIWTGLAHTPNGPLSLPWETPLMPDWNAVKM